MLAVDAGDFSGGLSAAGRVESRCVLEAMKLMHYDAVALGERDVFQGETVLKDGERRLGGKFLASNVYDAASGAALGDTLRIIRAGRRSLAGWGAGGTRIALIGVTRNDFAPALARRDSLAIRVDPPIDTVKRLVERVRGSVDAIVVLAHLGREGAETLAREVPGIDLIIVGHASQAPPDTGTIGDARLVGTGDLGREIGDLTFTAGAGTPFTLVDNHVVSLPDSMPEDRRVGRLVAACQGEKRRPATSPSPPIPAVRVPAEDDSSIRALAPPAARASYLGASSCRTCHAAIYARWSRTPHAHAFESLRATGKAGDIRATRYATTGFGSGNGFRSIELTPGLTGVQCEECHGPGSAHVARLSPPGAPQTAVRGELTRGSGIYVCIRCHYRARDPGFDYDRDLKRGSHEGR